MATMKLGKLQEVDIRKLWSHEQYDFSEWLSKSENLELLNEAIGLTLSEVEKEVYVGAYRCDLVGTDETTGDKVIIENQLEISNHDHLGKIITYASGLDAKVVVWIVKEAREEHRSAIEWLNNNTPEKLSFFLIEIHAYQIGDSLCAPKFEVVEKPNGFIKNAKTQSSGSGDYNKSQGERIEFWTRFNEILVERGKPFNVRKATTDHWYDIAIGTSDAHVSLTLVNKDGYVGVEFYIRDNKDLFDKLYAQKEEIENRLGLEPDWQRLDGKKSSRVLYRISGLDFNDHSNYDSLMNEMIDKAVLFANVFKKYV
ncbi:DUF4268 domain-containing protein [Oribacterium sp. FC2011]|uniref:DUF4268 domain-containing protein n=1 Tax=Oribacterium sp. FC2011 TaxID=1408311 RepID=UPI0005D2A28B|nr:DUF4268 domain-containing protein [Oribacterium sp. FC2011]